MKRIGIQPDDLLLRNGTTQSFSNRWIERLRELGHEPVVLDASKDEFFEQVKACDGFMWVFYQSVALRHFGRRVVAALEHGMGMPVYPAWNTVWTFDDKIAQYYLLRAAGLPTPKNWIFYFRHHAMEFCRTARYPMVIKLAAGVMSNNVRLVHNFDEAEYWINRLFGAGLISLEKPTLNGVNGALKRGRDAMRLLAKGLTPGPLPFAELQRGYLLLQEFLPGNEFDTRVSVIGNRAFAFRRHNRPDDFRASGSGRIDWDVPKIDLEMVRLAIRARRKLGSQSLAIDGLYRNGEPTIIETSYVYDTWAVEACPGHWEVDEADVDATDLQWVEGHVKPEDVILDDFLALVDKRAQVGSPRGRNLVPAVSH
jgi:glutathione synthase/RimK-type ligase-like ATP-grasp enzyme